MCQKHRIGNSAVATGVRLLVVVEAQKAAQPFGMERFMVSHQIVNCDKPQCRLLAKVGVGRRRQVCLLPPLQ
ncbi:hypothetical protein D3C77_600520 [compost metagenome]